MSRERQYATRLAHLASHDALTGLLNRREFERRVSAALREGQQHASHHAILYLDLDEFKVVNDTCGHAAGDELLRQVSPRCRGWLRRRHALAPRRRRVGVLLEHCGQAPALVIADACGNAISDFHFQWKQRSFKIGVSIGVVNITSGPETLAGVLSMADAACYRRRTRGATACSDTAPKATGRGAQGRWNG